MGYNTVDKKAIQTPDYVSVDKDTRKFRVRTSTGEEFQVDNFSGFIRDIRVRESSYEGQAMQKLEIAFMDEQTGAPIIFTTGMESSHARGVLNSLSNIPRMTFPVGFVVEDKKGKNGKTYARVDVVYQNRKIAWRFPAEEIPYAEEIKNSRGEVLARDRTAQTEWIMANIMPHVIDSIDTSLSDSVLVALTNGDPSPHGLHLPMANAMPKAIPQSVSPNVPFSEESEIPSVAQHIDDDDSNGEIPF